MDVPDTVVDALERLELRDAVDDAVLGRLGEYLALLLEANQRMNLTAVREAEAAWHRLIVDSLTLLHALDELRDGAAVLDVGTGGGLPGLPVAIARAGLTVTLLETTGKKCDFLRGVVEAMGLENVSVLQGRAEDLAHEEAHRQSYDAVVSRAVGPMPVVLELTMPFAKFGGGEHGGLVLAMKGPKAEGELMAAGDALAALGAGELLVYAAYPESFGNDLVIVSVRHASPTPKGYPRQAGIPKRSPL